MIPFDIVYYKPETLEEAGTAFREASDEGLEPRFLSGGTELVTMARDNRITSRAFIDLKAIPACRRLASDGQEADGQELVVGSCVTLNEVIEAGEWELLSKACRGIADHTVRNTLTVGGNAAGMLPYREALLPFLVAQGYATIAGAEGTRRERLRELFNKRLKLKNGEFLVDLRVPRSVTTLHSYYARRTKDARVDYPLLSLTMLRDEAGIRAAFAGTASYPVADDGADDLLSGSGSPASRADQVAARIEKSIRSDMRGGAKYRRFLLTDALEAGIAHLSSTS